MYDISLDIYQTAAVGAVILVLGIYILSKSETLKRFCIPAAVVGGILFSLVNCLLHYGNIATIGFDPTLKNFFMTMFFCSVGFMASFKMLKTGGKLVILLLSLVAGLLFIQDLVGPALAALFGLDPKLGLCLGSISLVGGHGTAASYGELLFEEYGITEAEAVAVAAATFGLAVSGFIGGPLARKRVKDYNLVPDALEMEFAAEEEKIEDVDNNKFLHSLIYLLICIGAGTYIVDAFNGLGITVPTYLGAMILAMVIRNVADRRHIELPTREITALGGICLAMFLSMALMSLELWTIASLAVPMVFTIVVQLIVVALYAYFVIFNLTGRNYDSAVFVTASCGFGLGATPNAVANMEALFKEHGMAPTAYLVVPLVGSVFIDFINTGVISVFLNIL